MPQALRKSSKKSTSTLPKIDAKTSQNGAQDGPKSKFGGDLPKFVFESEILRSWEASWGGLGAYWERLGRVLGASWGRLGAVLGVLGRLGGVLGPS